MKQEQGKSSIYQKIQNVSNKVRNIEKDMTVGKGSYSYKAVSDLQVTLAVKQAETEEKLISIPVKQDLVSSEIVKSMKKEGHESITYVDTIKMTVKIIDLESGEEVEIESFGKGIDSGDKGFGKASTYARKYALLNAYKIALGDDPDSEPSKQELVMKKPSEKLQAISDYLAKRVKAYNEILKHFGVENLDSLNESQINQIYKSYKEKDLI